MTHHGGDEGGKALYSAVLLERGRKETIRDPVSVADDPVKTRIGRKSVAHLTSKHEKGGGENFFLTRYRRKTREVLLAAKHHSKESRRPACKEKNYA